MRRIGIGLFIVLVAVAGCGLFGLPVVRGPILNSLLGRSVGAPTEQVVERRYEAAAGYGIEIFATEIPNARFLRISPEGSLLVSQPREGKILHILADADGDGRSDGVRTLVEGLDRPHGLDFHGDHLFVGETGGIARVPFSERGRDTIRTEGPLERIVEGLPPGGNHWSRTLRFGPDGGLYLHVGSSCNVCEEEDARRATILRFEPDGSGEEIYAAGLRNSVGFDWQPGTNLLFATDNGRDLLGDDFPPCELNQIERGQFYGWPYANGDNVPDPDFGEGNADKIAASTPPSHDFRAHNAPLGITFLRHPNTPPALRGAALVALHGSWNRSELDGYKVVSLHWNADGTIEEREFMTGFEEDGDVVGRPVDVIEGADGSIYVSDDYAGVIYRLRQGAAATAAVAVPTPASSESAATPGPGRASLAADELARLDLQGAALFDQHACGTCHLADQAVAGMVSKPLDGLAVKYGIEGLARFFVTPTPPMPVFPLDDGERRALAVHLLGRFE